MGRLEKAWRVAAVSGALLMAMNCGGEGSDAEPGDTTLRTDWGDLPIPASCRATIDQREEDDCGLNVECGELTVLTQCHPSGDDVRCECFSASGRVDYRLSGVSTADACPHALAACLHWPELDAGDFECTPTNDAEEPNFCLADAECTREGEIGDVEFVESHTRLVDCNATESGWMCGCGMPTAVRFEVTTAPSIPQCLDARDWCILDGVEIAGSKTCTPIEVSASEDLCTAQVDCQRPVLLDGDEATMYEFEVVSCYLAEGERYQCSCRTAAPYSTEVTADDAASACASAVDACEADG